MILYLAIILILIMVYSRISGGGERQLTVFTQEPWFSCIKDGRKKVEARVGRPNNYSKHIGENIIIKTQTDKVNVKLVDVKHYHDLNEYIDKEGWKNVAPFASSREETVEAYLNIKGKDGIQVYDNDRVIEKGGVVALHIG